MEVVEVTGGSNLVGLREVLEEEEESVSSLIIHPIRPFLPFRTNASCEVEM